MLSSGCNQEQTAAALGVAVKTLRGALRRAA
jgi:DNA-binding CsgD family transcriptional regulator